MALQVLFTAMLVNPVKAVFEDTKELFRAVRCHIATSVFLSPVVHVGRADFTATLDQGDNWTLLSATTFAAFGQVSDGIGDALNRRFTLAMSGFVGLRTA